MTPVEEICANCDHLQCGVWCLIHNQPTEIENTCDHWENAAVEEPPTTAANQPNEEKESR